MKPADKTTLTGKLLRFKFAVIYSEAFHFLPREAMHARYMLWPRVCLTVSPSVSVTSRCSTKTAKRRITQTTPHDNPGTLFFCRQRSPRNSAGVNPYGGAKCRWDGLKYATSDK